MAIDATGHTAADAVEENRVEPSCTVNGSYDSVVYCATCGVELSREAKTLDALGHDIVAHEAQAPTCTEIGWDAYETCSRCDYTTYKQKHPNGHNPSVTKEENRIEETCTINGSYDSVVYCSVCDKELSRENKVIAAPGHNLVHHDAKEATCTEIGWNAYDTCRACDYTTYAEIPAHGHTAADAVEENRVEPSCTANGSYDSVVYCATCGVELSREAKTLDALGHDIVAHEAQAPTCTEIGWDAYETCSRCDYTTYKQKHPNGHNPSVTKEENRIEETCTINGSYDSVVYCSVCDKELSRENKVIAAPGHNLVHHDAKEATCTEIGWNAYDECRVCDYTTYVEIPALGHKYGESTIVEPEYQKEGYTTHTCSVCNHEEKYDITDALTYVLGDADGNETIDSDDAIYLLFHTLLPEQYPVNQKCDFDGDGDLDSDDAIYLLYHTLLLEKYPLHK